MQALIQTTQGPYSYRPAALSRGRKVIDKGVSKRNLLDAAAMLDSKGIGFGIIYGTLLGAVREKDFIDYDEDVDLYIKEADREAVLSLLFELRKMGLEVARYEGHLLSLMREDDYIDIYFFKKKIFGGWKCNEDALPNKFFKGFDTVEFLGRTFNAPKNHIAFLERAYGSEWMIPRRDKPADVKSIKTRMKRFVPPALLKLYLFLKSRWSRLGR